MITISTTTLEEARDMAARMRSAPAGTGYEIFLLGRQVITRLGGGQEILDPRPAVWPADGNGILGAEVAPPADDVFAPPQAGAGAAGMLAPEISGAAAVYDVMFPVRARVAERFGQGRVELAAEVAFWQHPPDECTVPRQELSFTWMDDLLRPGGRLIRVSGDVIPGDVPEEAPVPIRPAAGAAPGESEGRR